MGERITFRERGRKHFSNTNAPGYPAQWSRVKFVDGQETPTPSFGFVACGNGTAFPMLVPGATVADNLKIIEELVYRVKDAWFTSGSLDWTYTYMGTPYPTSFRPPVSGPPANRTVQIDATTIQKRGYSVEGADDYNDPIYDPGFGWEHSDIADNERGLWRPCWRNGYNISSANHLFVDAFDFYEDSYNSVVSTSWTGGDADAGDYGGHVECIRGPRVAVVKVNPTDGLFAATNKFYLEFEFFWFDYPPYAGWGGGTNIYDGQSGYGDFSATAIPQCLYTIRLKTGDVSCQIYMLDAGDNTSVTGSDIVHEAIEWWPYKTKAGLPAWDSTTGLPLNGGPGA